MAPPHLNEVTMRYLEATCPVCEKWFLTATDRDLKRYLRLHGVASLMRYTCRQCGAEFHYPVVWFRKRGFLGGLREVSPQVYGALILLGLILAAICGS